MAARRARPITSRSTLNQLSNGVTLQNDATITRYNDTLTATYVLTDAKGTEVTRGSQTSLSSFNVSNSPYSTLAVQQDSDRRAADDLADRIRTGSGRLLQRAAMIVKTQEADRFAANPPKTSARGAGVRSRCGPGAGTRREAC